MKTITWKTNLGTFIGRNGTFKCRGIHFISSPSTVLIAPITSKNNIGRCAIEIPLPQARKLAKMILGG
jgi:hypothetical protein